MQFVRSQHTIEELLRSFVSIMANRAAQAPPVGRCGMLHHPLQDLILGFRKLIDVVDEIDKQKLLRERLRKARLHAKRELAVAKLKLAVAALLAFFDKPQRMTSLAVAYRPLSMRS